MEWSEKRWPGFIHMLLRLFHLKAADQGALRIRLDEPAALGRMALENREGGVLYALIDGSRTRDKWFYLPADTMEAGAVLKNEAGEALFSLAAGDPPIPGNEPQTAEQKAPQPDEASGLEIRKGETES